MTRLKGWRRVANAIWQPPNDPQVYGALEVDATPLLDYMAQARTAGHHVTPTHLVGRAVATALREVPELNVRIVGMRAVPRPSIDLFFIAAVEGGRDLSGVKLERVDQRSAAELSSELTERARRLKQGKDREFTRSKRTMDGLPLPLMKLAVRGTAVLTERFQLDVPALGLHKSPFGSAMITSVGMFGLPQGFAPIAWMYDVPLLVLVGEISEKAVVVDHQVTVRPMLPLTATIDHRYADGYHISQVVRAVRAYLAAPEDYEPRFNLG